MELKQESIAKIAYFFFNLEEKQCGKIKKSDSLLFLGFNGGSSLAGGGLVGLVGNCGGEYMTVVEMVVLLVVAGVRLTGLMLLEDDEDAAEKSLGSVFCFLKYWSRVTYCCWEPHPGGSTP